MKCSVYPWVVGAMLLAPAVAAAEGAFDQCLVRLEAMAEREGVRAETTRSVLANVSEARHVIELDRRQPEFTDTFANYFNRSVSAERIAWGRQSLQRHADLLARLTARYGVPGHYLVALWGMETNYGRYLGSTPVFDALATLACDQRRSDFFSAELVYALRVVDREGLRAGAMIGSWAGAMGQTQFMPSSYARYAVDGDGDGVIDLWSSVPDALASAANLLRSVGWQPGERWGREVRLPEEFDYYLSGRDRTLSLAEWRRLGVTAADGSLLPALDMQASLLVPAGHRGPAFLVYGNFDALMEWNRSEFFALSVGHLADRIAGAGRLHTAPPSQPRLRREQVIALQEALAARGYDPGAADGILGPATRAAVREFQRAGAWTADGHVDQRVLQALGIHTDGLP